MISFNLQIIQAPTLSNNADANKNVKVNISHLNSGFNKKTKTFILLD